MSSSTNSRSCCSARTRVTCSRVAKPFVTRISPRRSSGLRRFSRRAISSCSGVTAPSRTRSVPRAGHGFLAASMYRRIGSSLPWLRDVRLRRRDSARTGPMRAVIQRVSRASRHGRRGDRRGGRAGAADPGRRRRRGRERRRRRPRGQDARGSASSRTTTAGSTARSSTSVGRRSS